MVCYNICCIVAVCYSIKHHKFEKESGAEGEEEIGDSQDHIG